MPEARSRWGEQLARIPWTTKELKRHLKRRYREDERVTLELLAMEGSIAGANYCQLGLNRAVLKGTFRRLRHNRRQQVVLANIICATRFEFFEEEGALLRVRRRNGCGEVDSLDHLLNCHNLGMANADGSFEEKVDFLKSMAVRTARNCPILPTPIPRSPAIAPLQSEEYEISLGSPGVQVNSDGHREQSEEWSLEIDQHLDDADTLTFP